MQIVGIIPIYLQRQNRLISEPKHRKDESKNATNLRSKAPVVAVIIEVGIITLGVVGNSNLITSRPGRVEPRGMLNHI